MSHSTAAQPAQHDPDYYVTRDPDLASYLVAVGLDHHSEDEGGFVQWVFQRDKAEPHVSAFNSGSARIEPLRMCRGCSTVWRAITVAKRRRVRA